MQDAAAKIAKSRKNEQITQFRFVFTALLWKKRSVLKPARLFPHAHACGDAERAGLPFTLHTDTPVLRPNLLEAAWCAVNRITKAGVQLDEDQKVTPYEAMRAITYNGAYQYGEEADKGTLEAGKLADVIVVDRDLFSIPPEEIRDASVVLTIMDGAIVYEK